MRNISVLLLTLTLTLTGCSSTRLSEFKEKLREEKVTGGGERSIEYVNLLDKTIEVHIDEDRDAVAVLKPRNPALHLDEQRDNRYWFKQLWNDESPVSFTLYVIETNGPVCIAKHPFSPRNGVMPNDQPEPHYYEIDEKFIAKQHQPKGWFKKVAKK